MAIFGVDYDCLYEALKEKRDRRGLSWRRVAAEIGIPSATFTRIKDGKGVADGTFVSLMYWLGVADSIEPFLKGARTCGGVMAGKTVGAAESEE